MRDHHSMHVRMVVGYILHEGIVGCLKKHLHSWSGHVLQGQKWNMGIDSTPACAVLQHFR